MPIPFRYTIVPVQFAEKIFLFPLNCLCTFVKNQENIFCGSLSEFSRCACCRLPERDHGDLVFPCNGGQQRPVIREWWIRFPCHQAPCWQPALQRVLEGNKLEAPFWLSDCYWPYFLTGTEPRKQQKGVGFTELPDQWGFCGESRKKELVSQGSLILRSLCCLWGIKLWSFIPVTNSR